MSRSKNYKGCHVLIYDEDGDNVCHSIVTEYNRNAMTILVQGSPQEIKCRESVIVLILTDDSTHEYHGNVRKSASNAMMTEIALFKGTTKAESRAVVRYPVKTAAIVEGVTNGSALVPLRPPVSVQIVNLSATGALIRAGTQRFAADAIIEMKLDIGNKATSIYCKIVRIKNIDEDICEYGCKFVLVN